MELRRMLAALALLGLPGLALGQGRGAPQGPAPAPAKAEAIHPGFARSALKLTHEFAALYRADLNGDGLEDLIVIEAERMKREPELYVSVFQQNREGFRAAGGPQPLPSAPALAGGGGVGGGAGRGR